MEKELLSKKNLLLYAKNATQSILNAPADLFVQPAGKHPYRLN